MVRLEMLQVVVVRWQRRSTLVVDQPVRVQAFAILRFAVSQHRSGKDEGYSESDEGFHKEFPRIGLIDRKIFAPIFSAQVISMERNLLRMYLVRNIYFGLICDKHCWVQA